MTTCSRCQRTIDKPLSELTFYDDAGNVDMGRTWTGSQNEPVCPGCQLAGRHPHCTSVRVEAGYGERIDTEALARGEAVVVQVDGEPVIIRSAGELKTLGVGWCDYIDLTLSFVGELPHLDWKCPHCGGTEHEFVQADYMEANLKGTSFNVTAEEGDEGDA